jgi:hypothetical protein
VSCGSISSKVLQLQTTFFTTCKANNLDLPYVHKALADAIHVWIELEFEGSMPSLMPQLMRVLEISKVSNITERDGMLQVGASCTCSSP